MKKDTLKPDFNGLPPIKKQYEKDEKILLVKAVEEYGLEAVMNAYGLKSRSLLGWQRYYNDPNHSVSNNEVKPVKPSANQKAKLIIQSPAGQEITSEEILKKVGNVDMVYIRVDENAAYWVRGEENGSVNLW